MELTAGFAPAMSTLPMWCIAIYAWSAKWGSDWIRTSVKRPMKPLPYSSSHGTVNGGDGGLDALDLPGKNRPLLSN